MSRTRLSILIAVCLFLALPAPAQKLFEESSDLLPKEIERMYLKGLQFIVQSQICLLYTSPSPRDGLLSRMPSSA